MKIYGNVSKIAGFACVLMTVLLSSCDIDDEGNASINGTGWFLLACFAVFCVVMTISTINSSKKTKAYYEKEGLKEEEFKLIGKYVGGHPSIKDVVNRVTCRKIDEMLVLYSHLQYAIPVEIKDARIPIADITNISIEDKTSIERRMTVGRLFLVGIFAFAWKKKKKDEMAFVVIEWKMGKFSNETLFCFEGKNAMMQANNARSEIMNMCQ